MKWSLKVGKILGIDVYIHLTFLLLLAFVGAANWVSGRSVEAAISGLVFFSLLFLCVLLHEYGHALAARRYGIATHDITLLPIGGVARLEKMPEKPSQELVVALAGPAVNVVIAAALFIGLQVGGNWQPWTTLSATDGSLLQRLLAVNVLLVVFNLLPAFPMDGGRVLRALLAMRMRYARATRVAATIGQAMAFLFGFVGLFGNPFLLFIALFVWIGASQEAAAAEQKGWIDNSPVRAAMLTDFRTLSPDQQLGDVAKLILAGCQQNFPVLEADRYAGILSQTDLIEGLRRGGAESQVGNWVKASGQALAPEEELEPALTKLGAEPGHCLPVMQNGRLVGLLTAENVGEFLLIRRALAESTGKPPVILHHRRGDEPSVATA